MTTHPSKEYLNDAVFSDLLFHAMMNATAEQKNNIPDKWLKHLENRRTCHRFCLHQPYERQLVMWHYLGNSWVTIIGTSEHLIDMTIMNAGDQFSVPEKRKDFINAMSNKRVCATSSRELMMNLMMVDIDSKSQNYKFNKNAEELSRHAKKWNDLPTLDVLQRKAAESFQIISAIIANVLVGIDNIPTLTGVSRLQCNILLVLMQNRYAAFTPKAIASQLNMKNSMKGLFRTINYMMASKLIIVDIPDQRGVVKIDTAILISEHGIKASMIYLNNVVGNALKK